MKKLLSSLAILAALLILTTCNSAIDTTQSTEPTFAAPASMTGTWNLYPGDSLPEGFTDAEMLIFEDNLILMGKNGTGKLISIKDAFLSTNFPNLRLTYSEVKEKYFYELTISLLNPEDNFLTQTRMSFEINPSNPDFLLFSVAGYNDESGWSETIDLRYLKEGTELPRFIR